jgi:16S rRNA (guanine1207-N2)-methyltransferase
MRDVAEHYFSPQPSGAFQTHPVPLTVDGRTVELAAAPGVFSAAQVDAGTMVLLTEAPLPPPDGTLLDLGCGYGPIACALGIRSPGAAVIGVDVNERALSLTRANADALGLHNITACTPDEVPADLSFNRIYSNPPIRVGKVVLHETLTTWLGRLTDDGRAYLVVHKNLGSDSLHRWLREQGHDTARLISVRGFRVLEVQRRERR